METARARPNPDFSFTTGRQIVRVPGNVAGFAQVYSFSQPLELGALRPRRIEQAQTGVVSAELGRAEIRLSVLTRVRRAFFQVLRRTREIDLATENLRLVEDLRNRIQVRVEVGEAGRLELVRAEAEVAIARTQANSARIRLATEQSQFRAAVGTPLDPVLTLDGNLDAPVTLPPLADLSREAVERHPALAVARAEMRRAEARIAYEESLRRPQPSVRVDVERWPDVPNYRVGVDIPLPFWNRRKGPIAEAVAGLRQSQAVARARIIELEAALGGAYARYLEAGQQIAAFEQGLIREAEAGLQAAETAYRLGERGILDVLDAQRVLRSVRLDFLNAQFDRQAALVDLDELRAVELRSAQPRGATP